jgi:hypothetical protein
MEMDRTNFFTIVKASVTGKSKDTMEELDFLWNPLTAFELTYDPTYYRVAGSDIMRPDTISYNAYGTPDFWWIICLINSIDNPLIDMQVGQILKIPNPIDIFNFQRKYRVRRST